VELKIFSPARLAIYFLNKQNVAVTLKSVTATFFAGIFLEAGVPCFFSYLKRLTAFLISLRAELRLRSA
jgi:hypothetical protein